MKLTKQEAIRIVISACSFAPLLGLAIVANTGGGYAIAAMWLPISWVMIPEPKKMGVKP